ncbi:hypothetical protein [Fibrella aquatica]|uniref:hypothetical protein n=1 Tax=Fibrella aquatica TaxID=3242487 RepID=UPI0035222D0C
MSPIGTVHLALPANIGRPDGTSGRMVGEVSGLKPAATRSFEPMALLGGAW